MDSRVTELLRIGDGLFSTRGNLMSYWQDLAENFYPERADFTTQRSDGDWWTGLMSSEPVLKRREAANLMQSMLRPESKDWFSAHIADETLDQSIEARRWMEYITSVQRRAMYFSAAHLVEATKLADHDWWTFGMAVLRVDVRRDQPSLFYRCDHIRDHAWAENAYGEIDTDYMKWRPSARTLVHMFGDKVHREVKTAMERDPERKFECCYVVRPREGYEDKRTKSPRAEWMSIYIDKENQYIMEETPLLWFPYVIPRWQRIHGSQYGWSPATGPGLSDAMTLQQVMRTILEAGEKAVDPPLLAYEEALRSDINIYARGITYVDQELDERMGEPLRELYKSKNGLPFGLEILDRHNRILHEGFFLDKLQLPDWSGQQPTAYHVRQILEEHIRANVPLLAPAEEEYNAKLCEKSFEILRAMKAFGPEEDFPPEIQNRDIRYEFQSPIREMADELNSQKLLEGLEIVGAAGQIDEAQIQRLNLDTAVLDALQGKNLPATWIRSDKEFAQIKQQIARAKQIKEGAEALGQGAEIAGRMSEAQQLLTTQRQQ